VEFILFCRFTHSFSPHILSFYLSFQRCETLVLCLSFSLFEREANTKSSSSSLNTNTTITQKHISLLICTKRKSHFSCNCRYYFSSLNNPNVFLSHFLTFSLSLSECVNQTFLLYIFCYFVVAFYDYNKKRFKSESCSQYETRELHHER
jgi:hypothetical protein